MLTSDQMQQTTITQQEEHRVNNPGLWSHKTNHLHNRKNTG